jgi:hypothetical protein
MSRKLWDVLEAAAEMFDARAAVYEAEAAFQIGNEVDGDPEPCRAAAKDYRHSARMIRSHVARLRAEADA